MSEHKDPAQKKTLILYAAFIAGLALQAVPVVAVQAAALALILGVLTVIGRLRRASSPDGLLYNHATYLSRTFWAWSVLMVVGGILGGYYLFTRYGDFYELLRMADALARGQADPGVYRLLSAISLAAFGPGILYLCYRVVRGFDRAVRGYRVARPDRLFP